MKRLSYLFLIVLTALMSFPSPVKAAEETRILSRTVEAEVHADKTVTVHEEGLLQFGESGAQTLFAALLNTRELYRIEQAAVQPGVSRLSENDLIVDFDVPPSGQVSYTLDYTIRFYNRDESSRQNMLELMLDRSLFGWLAQDSLTYRLTLADSMTRDNWHLDCGTTVNQQCRYGSAGWEGQTFTFTSTQPLSGNSLPLQIEFQAGAFPDIQSYVYPAVYQRCDLNIEVLKNGDLHIIRQIDMQIQDESAVIELDLYTYPLTYPDAEIQNLTCSDPTADISEKYGFLTLRQIMGPYSIRLDYTIHPRRAFETLTVDLSDHFNQLPIESLTARIQMPGPLNTELVTYDQNYEPLTDIQENWNAGRTAVIITAPQGLGAMDRVSFRIEADPAVIHYPLAAFSRFWVMYAMGMIAAAAGFRFLMRAPASTSSSAAVPGAVNPLQARLLTGKALRTEDVSDVILNWIARGHLTVLRQESDFVLTKDKPMNWQPAWEKELMASLLSYGSGSSVRLDELPRRFWMDERRQAEAAARLELHERTSPAVRFLKKLMLVLVILPPAALGLGAVLERLIEPGDLLLILLSELMLLCGVTRMVNRSSKAVPGRRLGQMLLVSFVLGVVLIGIAAGLPALNQQTALCLGAVWLCLLLILPISALNRESLKKKGELKRWRQFLVAADFQKLSARVDQDEEYPMKSYVLACALEVEEIWEKQFSALILPPLAYVKDADGKLEAFDTLRQLRHRLRQPFLNQNSSDRPLD